MSLSLGGNFAEDFDLVDGEVVIEHYLFEQLTMTRLGLIEPGLI